MPPQPTLPLPPVPDTIQEGRQYVVTEILFTLAAEGWGEVNWHAFVEPETGAVLYLRPFVDWVTGCVYLTDPVTRGEAGITPAAPAAALDALRAQINLLGLIPPNPGADQTLTSQFVQLQGLRGASQPLQSWEPQGAALATQPPLAFVDAEGVSLLFPLQHAIRPQAAGDVRQ
jgi:zinc metalloprotease ZmpB